MKEENPQNEKSWFSDVSWKSALIVAAIAFLSGGGAGGAISATKAVQTQGLSQDQADVRYLTKTEADARGNLRDKQFESVNKKLDEKMLSREVYEAVHSNDMRRIDVLENKIDRILENQNRGMR